MSQPLKEVIKPVPDIRVITPFNTTKSELQSVLEDQKKTKRDVDVRSTLDLPPSKIAIARSSNVKSAGVASGDSSKKVDKEDVVEQDSDYEQDFEDVQGRLCLDVCLMGCM